MKYRRLFLAVTTLALASLSCQALSGGGESVSPGGESSSATQSSGNDSSTGGGNADTSASGFPITADAYNVIDIGDGSVLFYTKMSLEDVMEYYRDVYVSQGYTERGLLTVTSDTTFSMVFDGDPSGKAVVIQSVDLGDGSCTVSIRLEDV
jgi:hypothetical protein